MGTTCGSLRLAAMRASRRNRAEAGVWGRQLGVLVHHEDRAAVGPGTGVGHRQGAAWIKDGLPGLGVVRRVLVGRVLVGELVARTAGAVALGVTALQDAQV